MERQRWLLLPGERDRAENHIGLFILPICWVLIWLMYRMYYRPEDAAVWPWIAIIFIILSLQAIYTDLWLFGWFSTSDDGIHCGGWVTKQRFIPWDAVTDVCVNKLWIMRGNYKDIICCCLNGSKPPRRKCHETSFYAMHKHKYFIVRYSDERYTYFLQKTGKILS